MSAQTLAGCFGEQGVSPRVRAGPALLPPWAWVHQAHQVDTAEKEGPCKPGTSSARFVSCDFILFFMSHDFLNKSVEGGVPR